MFTKNFSKYALTLLIVGAFFMPQTQAAKNTSSASYQSSTISKHSWGVGIGQTFLFRDFADNGDDGVTMDLFYSYDASKTFDFLVNYHRSKHTYQGNRTSLNGLTASVKSKIFDFDSFAPFLLGGLGFYRPRLVRNGIESRGKNTFGFNVGTGADLQLNPRYTVGVLLNLHQPFEVQQDNQGDVGGTYMKLLMTLMYKY